VSNQDGGAKEKKEKLKRRNGKLSMSEKEGGLVERMGKNGTL